MNVEKSMIKSDIKEFGLPFEVNTESIVFQADCLEGMKEFKDDHFDLAVVDPPYGIDAEKGQGKQARRLFRNKVKGWDVIPGDDYFAELTRVSKRQIIFGMNYFKLPLSKNYIVWIKGKDLIGRCFSEAELAWVSPNFKGSGVSQGRLFFGEIKDIPANDHLPSKRIHPTQKPIRLYDWIFNKYSRPGELILDTHLGSGSSRIAAHKAGLNFTGFERDEVYFTESERRFKNILAQENMFK
jgi:site-specific DNA-methyltransferase (adenine-specific)